MQLILHKVHALLLRVELDQHKGEEGERVQVFNGHHQHFLIPVQLMIIVPVLEYGVLLSLQHIQFLVECDLVSPLWHPHLHGHVLGCLKLRVEDPDYLDLLLQLRKHILQLLIGVLCPRVRDAVEFLI